MVSIGGKKTLLKGKINAIKALYKKISIDYKKQLGEIAIVLVDDNELLEMNKTYLQHEYYTDIITHDYSEGNFVSGDLYISFDTVKDNAKTFNTMFHEELLRIIIHGFLHLVGENDKTKKDKDIMTSQENKYIEHYKTIESSTGNK